MWNATRARSVTCRGMDEGNGAARLDQACSLPCSVMTVVGPYQVDAVPPLLPSLLCYTLVLKPEVA
jgi:hypothetical protein